jgi:creatinine amidohydrolase
MRFDEINWFDVESYLKVDDRIMLVIGSCEQHGYLSLMTDVKIPIAVADAVSQRTGVLVGPPVNFGASPYFLAYPGTISLRIATLMDVVEDMIRSLFTQGFRRFLFLNGHGGNEPIRGRLFELINEIPELKIGWYSWWQSHSIEAILIKNNLKSFHAGWIEAFPFTQVADLPEGEKLPPHVPRFVNAREAREVYDDGVFGGKYQVEKRIMDEIFAAIVADVDVMLYFE